MIVKITHPFGFLFRGKHVQFGDVLDVTVDELALIWGRCQPIYTVPPTLQNLQKPRERPYQEMMLALFRRGRRAG